MRPELEMNCGSVSPGAAPSRGKTGRALRLTAVLGLLTLTAALLHPWTAKLVPFLLVTIWTNGPHSPVLPAAYEPVLLAYGQMYPPILIGALGTAGTVLVERFNYHLYVGAADLKALGGVRRHALVQRVCRAFRRAPFVTITVCALTPIPYCLARTLSALTRYSVPRHLAATALGRFPRLWLIAALGTPLGIPVSWLLWLTALTVLAALGILVARRLRRRRAPSPLSKTDGLRPAPTLSEACSRT